MSLVICPYTVRIIRQDVNAKGKFKYDLKEVDLKTLTQGELDFLFQKTLEIQNQVTGMLIKEGEEE